MLCFITTMFPNLSSRQMRREWDEATGTGVSRPTPAQLAIRPKPSKLFPGWHHNKPNKRPPRPDVKNKNYTHPSMLAAEPGAMHAAAMDEVYGRTVNPGLDPAEVYRIPPEPIYTAEL